MKILYLTIFFCAFFNAAEASVYFWEAYRDGERSCCLFLNGADICNPYTPCTRNAAYDLNGIFDYISRLLQVDKAGNFPYQVILNQAQNFIRQALTSGMRMYYRYDEPPRAVKFFHEIAEITKSEKPGKTLASSGAQTEKQKADDALTAYLMKMGLAWPLKK